MSPSERLAQVLALAPEDPPRRLRGKLLPALVRVCARGDGRRAGHRSRLCRRCWWNDWHARERARQGQRWRRAAAELVLVADELTPVTARAVLGLVEDLAAGRAFVSRWGRRKPRRETR